MKLSHSRVAAACLAGLIIPVALATSTVPASAGSPGTEHRPDLQTVIPTSAFSIVAGDEGREFRYTHLVYNNGPGPLEVQPSYDEAIGGYRGQQLFFTHNAAGVWSKVRDTRVPDTFIYHAEHGHFHFPLASFGLYAVAPDGGFGAPVALSPKIGFCIDDSYIYNSTVAHSGTFIGGRSSCTDPSGLRGIPVGGADEYDYRDPGQAIPIDGLADGTYWFRAMTDPNNDMVEADESNNETDVKVTIASGRVTAGQVLHPDTTPPIGAFTAPTDGAVVSGAVPLAVTTINSTVRKVEFVADGEVIAASTSTSSPFRLIWDSTKVVDGEHWLSARIIDSQGRVGNTGVTSVIVSNVAPPPSGDALALTHSVSRDGRDAQSTPALTGLAGGELLLAFVSSDGPSGSAQSATVTGGGLTWTLVRRANGQPGTSEIWKGVAPASPGPITVTATPTLTGYDQSLTVFAFRASAGTGASSAAGNSSGAPGATLTTTRNGGWVFGTGNDWDLAAARTVGANQVIRHQWINASVGDTFWTQSQAAPTRTAGTAVSIDDPAPTGSHWNLASVEVLPESDTPPPPDTTKPVVTITDPEAGADLRGTINIGATAADNVGVKSVTFKVDGKAIGTDTTPPFALPWKTTTVTNGSHVLTAEAIDRSGNVGTSDGVTVAVDNSGPKPLKISIDAKVVRNGKSTLKSPGLTTKRSKELIVAFVSMGGPRSLAQSAKVSGGGMKWYFVKRSNTQHGVVEIWKARNAKVLKKQVITATPKKSGHHGSLTVVAFRNAQTTGVAGAGGAPSGPPSIYLPAVSDASWVFAVGNDWDRAVARTPVTGQVLQQQWLDTGYGDTFWVQSMTSPTTQAGLVTIADTAPTNDRWNIAAVEIKAKLG